MAERVSNDHEHTVDVEDVDVSRDLNLILDGLGLTMLSINNRRYALQVCNMILNFPIETKLNPLIAYMSGSSCEGVASLFDKNSDVDVMHIHPCNVIIASQGHSQVKRFPIQNGVYIMEDSISHPLFKRLRNVSGLNSNCHFQHCNGCKYLSHAKLQREKISFMQYLRRQVYPNLPQPETVELSGPSIATTYRFHCFSPIEKLDYDNVLAVPSPYWPNDINEWFERYRYKRWPVSRDIQVIKDGGCHLVAKGFEDSSEYDIEWRLSFSMAENILIHTFNNTQMKCYYFLKTLLKSKVKSQFPTLMCSYHVKTVMFWVCEEMGFSFFRKDSLLRCIIFCILKLCEFLYDGHLPCYFMPSYNLLTHKVDKGKFKKVAELFLQFTQRERFLPFISDLRSNAEVYEFPFMLLENILPSLYLSLFYQNPMHPYVKTLENKNATEIQHFFLAIFEVTDNLFSIVPPNENTLRVLRQAIFPEISFICLSALTKANVGNKKCYRLQRKYLNNMTNELAVDFSPGLLKRATVCYKTGKFTECMVIVTQIMAVLFSTDVLVVGFHLGELFKNIFRYMYTYISNSNARLRFTLPIIFSPLDRSLVPDFVLPEMDLDEQFYGASTKDWAYLDPIVYALGLAIVCQHEILDFITRDHFMQQLRDFFVTHKDELCYPNSAKRIIDNLSAKCNNVDNE